VGALVVDAVGPTEAAWLTRIRRLPVWTVPSRGRVVVVSPHPDDETLGLGGTLQQLHAAGTEVDLIAVTDGEASHPGTPGLGDRRRAELRSALARLGTADGTRVHHLGVADGEVADHEGTVAAAVAALADPATVVLGPWPDDGHTDHDAAGRAAIGAAETVGARAFAFPVWAWHWHEPATTSLLERAERVPLTATQLDRKRHAVAAHASQLSDEPGPAIVPPHVLRRLLRDDEVLVPTCA
jgi:LmbE family N-acetylglucosaminyl deacetylase